LCFVGIYMHEHRELPFKLVLGMVTKNSNHSNNSETVVAIQFWIMDRPTQNMVMRVPAGEQMIKIPSSQRESWITDFLNQPNMNNILRDQPRVQPAMNWKSHPGGGRLKSELFETGPSWYIRYQFTVYIYICMYVQIYIYILALSSPRLWLKWILSKHGGCQPNSWPFKQFQSEIYGNPLEFRGHPFSNTPNHTRTSDCWTYIQIYSHYIPVKNPYHNHILKLWYINSHMSSRQNPLHLSSCYCYGYRFWGGLSLSRVFTNQHIRDPTWSKFHS
jgi:hypothetical protein